MASGSRNDGAKSAFVALLTVGLVPGDRGAPGVRGAPSDPSIRPCAQGRTYGEMADKSITKVSAEYAPKGTAGQKYLASGVHLSMRLWQKESPTQDKPETVRDYETIGFVIEGKAELYIEGQRVLLEPGDSWVVPNGAKHRYKILELFSAVEVTSPPAEVHAREE
jgi:quercetin dioxygenase-like cupin family protein